MRPITRSSAFKKDFKRLQKRGYDLSRLRLVIDTLADGRILEERYRDHSLRGNYEGWRECHIGPDWLLVYALTDDELSLARTGTHADLFVQMRNKMQPISNHRKCQLQANRGTNHKYPLRRLT